MPKFDYILMNPPYGSKTNVKLEQKIVAAVIHYVSGELITLMPSNLIVGNSNFRATKECVEFMNDNETEIAIYSPEYAKRTFNISIANDLCIYVTKINGNKKVTCNGKQYESILDIKKDRYNETDKKYLEIYDGASSIMKWYGYDKNKKCFVVVPQVIGSGIIVAKSQKIYSNETITELINEIGHKKFDNRHCFSFDLRNEAENFIAYLKTDFPRYIKLLHQVTDSQVVQGEYIFKYIPDIDLEKEYTNDEILDMFIIDSKDKEYIKNKLPNYYSIR